ncbi:Zinc knuckle, partial [Trichostrongylus colubriformis]
MSAQEDSEAVQDCTENANANLDSGRKDTVMSPLVSGLDKAIEKLRSELRKIRTVVDDSLSKAFRTNSGIREKVYSDMNDQMLAAEAQLDIVRALALRAKPLADSVGKETLELLSSLYNCETKEIVSHAIDQDEKIRKLQAELVRAKAGEKKKLAERRRQILSGQEPMESELSEEDNECHNKNKSVQPTPRMTTSRTMGYSSNGRRGQSQSFISSSSSEEYDSHSHSSLDTARLMNEYMRAAAMPEVKPFANRKGEKFNEFLRQFNLKYPESTWRDNERRDILVGLLEGEAKMHYKTLPKSVRNASLQTLVCELKRRLKVDGTEEQTKAMRKLRKLRKMKDQSVLQFCLELEILSSKAHPSADNQMLSLIRAEILQEQLSHWPEAVQLLEILETEGGATAYEKIKEMALRIERLRANKFMYKEHKRQWECNRELKQETNGDTKVSATEGQDRKLSGRTPQRSRKDKNCSNCGKRGHEAQECWSRRKDSQAVSFSATLDSWCCKKVESESRGRQCQLIGPKHIVTLTCLGMKVKGMIDTGSQLTIMPLEILKRARDGGKDIDHLCTLVATPDVDAYDASGHKMDFLGCVELRLGRDGDEERAVKMHVKKLHDNTILLGTNALETLGIHIRMDKATSTKEAKSGLKQLILAEDTSHPLHLKFVCHEKQLVKPPGDYKGYRIGFKCPLVKEEDARRLCSVLHGLPETMGDVRFDSVGKLAELITIWMKEDWSEDQKLIAMARQKAPVVITGDALAVALLYFKKKCLHVQLSIENLMPEDVYHEALREEGETIRVSGIYQAAIKLTSGQDWKGP